MTFPKVILVPTDFSPAAETALDYALQMASKSCGKVYVMHEYQLPIVGFPDGALLPTAEIATRIISYAQSELAACVARRKESSVEIVPILKQDDPRAAVVSAADELFADLVIMGTHGRHGLAHALIGSVAEMVVRTSHVPVMTVHTAESRLSAARAPSR